MSESGSPLLDKLIEPKKKNDPKSPGSPGPSGTDVFGFTEKYKKTVDDWADVLLDIHLMIKGNTCQRLNAINKRLNWLTDNIPDLDWK